MAKIYQAWQKEGIKLIRKRVDGLVSLVLEKEGDYYKFYMKYSSGHITYPYLINRNLANTIKIAEQYLLMQDNILFYDNKIERFLMLE